MRAASCATTSCRSWRGSRSANGSGATDRSPADASLIWRDLLDALAHAHAHGVVHRDVKPGNILLSGRSALIADFGIARAVEAAGEAEMTAPGFAIGTPAYMAPEQIDGSSAADHRADLYASALVMYEMLEGRLPFSGDSPRRRPGGPAGRARRRPAPLREHRPAAMRGRRVPLLRRHECRGDRGGPRRVPRSVKRDWAFARAWLLREMQLTLAGES